MVADRLAGEMRVLRGEIMADGEALDDRGVGSEVAPFIVADEQRVVFIIERGKHQPRGENEIAAEDHPIPKGPSGRLWVDKFSVRTPAVFRSAPENPSCADRDREEAEVRPKERLGTAREEPAQHIGKPRAEKQADEDGRGAAVRDRDETKKPPAKLVAEIKGQAEIEKR
jgi:hypothetical protein